MNFLYSNIYVFSYFNVYKKKKTSALKKKSYRLNIILKFDKPLKLI